VWKGLWFGVPWDIAMRSFAFSELRPADLVVDANYESDRTRSTVGSEPLSDLTGTGNQGGFRFSGPTTKPNLVVLYTTIGEADWPDEIDEENGLFVYFGDNRRPGYELHDRKSGRGGNEILRRSFELAHSGPVGRAEVPPFLIFSKGDTGRDAVFRGLAVPGAAHLDQSSDLVAVWKSAARQRFQNYRAIFTILDVGVVPRPWLSELQKGQRLGVNCPAIWRSWVASGKPKPLQAEKVKRTRTTEQQLGPTPTHAAIAEAVHDHFRDEPIRFEHFAADVIRLMDANVIGLDVTRPSRDGGRDGVGRYRIGLPQNCVTVDFAMEAKCYQPSSGLGVRVVSRLISRLRHRQFGVLVTTTYLASQAYQEIVEDQHPIVVCSGGDVSHLLITKFGLHTPSAVREYLRSRYPLNNVPQETLKDVTEAPVNQTA
jgi:hypothetical protein